MCVKLIIIESPLKEENAFCKAAGVVLSRVFSHAAAQRRNGRPRSAAAPPRERLSYVLFGVVAGAVADFEFFFFQLGICDFD